MPSEALKSTPITNLDSTPAVANTTGEGAPGNVRSVSGVVTVTTGKTSGSTYQLCRFPSNAKMKHVWVGVDTTITALTADIGLYYSTSTVDGTLPANQGTKVNSTTGSQLFGAGVDLKTAALADFMSTLGGAKRNQPAWQAAGLTVDPGGYFDLVLTTTVTNNGAAVAYGEVVYVV